MKIRKKRHRVYAKDYIGWWVYAVLQGIFCILPAGTAYFIATAFGDVLFMFSRKNRAVIKKNLRGAFNFKEDLVKKYSREIFRNFSRNMLDFLRFRKFDEKWFSKKGEIVGIENLKKAFSRGRGVIAVSAHMGSWEIGALMVALKGFPINGIWASHSNPRVEEFFVNSRVEKGIKVILTGGAFKKGLQALMANELVFFVVDHSYRKSGLEVDFFGHKTDIPKGAAMAAIKSNATIIPVVALRGKGLLEHKLVCGEIIEYSLSGDNEKDMREIMQKCIIAIEGYISKYPDQWVLFRDQWKKKD